MNEKIQETSKRDPILMQLELQIANRIKELEEKYPAKVVGLTNKLDIFLADWEAKTQKHLDDFKAAVENRWKIKIEPLKQDS